MALNRGLEKMVSEKIILTGASDGIGRALAIELAKRKHSLALIARRTEHLEEVKKACIEAGAPTVLVCTVDVTNEDAFDSALESLDQKLGGCTIFIANAGVTGRTKFDSSAWSSTKHTLQVNVMAAIHGLELMKLKMMKRFRETGQRGILCGVSSIAASRGMPTAGAYSTSKAALTTHLESMRVDLAPYGVSVVTIAPGFIKTPMTALNKGKMPFLMKADRAAKVFADGLLKRKRFIVAPLPYRFIYPVIQMIPRPIFDYVMKKMYKSIRGE